MAELAILGTQEFLVGFELAGVRKTFSTEKGARNALDNALADTDIAILVLEQDTMHELPQHVQNDLSRSTKPVVVVLSTQQEQRQLRKDIIRAIGVDLWKSESQ